MTLTHIIGRAGYRSNWRRHTGAAVDGHQDDQILTAVLRDGWPRSDDDADHPAGDHDDLPRLPARR